MFMGNELCGGALSKGNIGCGTGALQGWPALKVVDLLFGAPLALWVGQVNGRAP